MNDNDFYQGRLISMFGARTVKYFNIVSFTPTPDSNAYPTKNEYII